MKFHELANIFPLLTEKEADELAQDIKEQGLLEPITLYEKKILDGRNRYLACKKVRVAPRFVEFEDDDPLAFVISMNLKRRHLNESQRAMAAARVATLRDGVRKDRQGAPIGAPTQDEAADNMKVGRRSVQRARIVLDGGVDELIAAVDEGRMAVSIAAELVGQPAAVQRRAARAAEDSGEMNKVRSMLRQGAALARTKAITLNAAELGKFTVLYADPPWQYEFPPMGGNNRSIENHYPTMPLEDIIAMGDEVQKLMYSDSVLFLWSTVTLLPGALAVMEAWGFDYRTCAVWIKDKIGMGYYFRNQHELLLVGRRGKMPPPVSNRPSSVVNAPRGRHSEKPDDFYRIIERMYPETKKIELFSRVQRRGWTMWGNSLDIEDDND